tara:strand:- start:803 stop:3175 length:2373 start_codon:yes stop_codon:yes gene_type:complete
MASGTQGYSKTTTDKSLADTLISEYKKLRKRAKAGGSDDPIDPANLKFVQDSVQAVDDFIVSGINGITSMFSTSASPVDAYDPVSYDDGTAIDINSEVVTENKKQTAILEQQNALLVKFIDLKRDQIADSKRLRQEDRMEDEEFLSGTQGFRKAQDEKDKKGGDSILTKIADFVTVAGGAVAAFKALPAVLKASILNGLKGLIPKIANIFKGFSLKGLGKKINPLNWFKKTAAKDATVNQAGKRVNVTNSLDDAINITDQVEDLSKNVKTKNNQLRLGDSKLKKVDDVLTNNNTKKEVLEEVLLDNSGSGKNISKNIKSANTNLGGGTGIVDDVVTAGAGTADDAATSIVKQVTAQPVKPKFNIKTFLNPRTINWKNMFKGGVVGIVTGMITGKINDALAEWEASSVANGISRKDIEGQKAEILRLKEEILKEEDWKKNPLFRLQQLWGILEAVVSMGGKSPLQIGDEKIRMNEMILEKLKNKGIDVDGVTVEGGETNNNEEINNTEVKGDENISSNSNAFSTENILGNQGVEVASTDLTGVLGDTNNISKVNGQNFFQTSSKTTNGELKGLTEEDYDYLAYAISGEAAQGTDDIYGVAASILNRKARGDGTVKEIISAPGQYKAFEDGTMKHSPDIKALLQSKEGQAKIMEALRVLEGRTDFKGQSQLGNRVASEDPMFDEKGNFYHHSWQTSGDSVKPEGWEPANWQQFMPTELEGAKGLSNKLSTSVASLSNETSNAPNIIVMPTTTNTASTSGSNDGGTQMSMIQLQTENKNLSAYAQNSLQSLNA